MNACSEDIKDILLADSNLGLSEESIWIGREPSKPSNTVTIFDTSTTPPMLTLRQGENYFHDAIQIRIRNTDYRVGYALANQIMVSLHGREQEAWNDTLYSVIFCTSGPAMLGWDDNNRVWFIINFECHRRDSDGESV